MHHSRRKSGHGSANTSMTDVRKAGAVAGDSASTPRHKTSRKSTAQTASKLGKSPRDREREWEEDRWWEEGESFPHYCMTCEKEFVPHDDKYPYCSEPCRMHDQSNTPASSTPYRAQAGYADSHLFYASGNQEPKDIIPRASPSRPSSMHFSSPAAAAASHTSAIAALRSLSIRDASPPSPGAAYHSTLWPLTSSTRSAGASPGTWYSRPSTTAFSSTYDTGYDGAGYGMMSDRPLPSRRPGHNARPKSIELLTPAW